MITKTGLEQWNSPEMLKGQIYTTKIDIWGLGCVFYFILTGEFPFFDHLISVLHERITTRQLDKTAIDKLSPS